VVASWVIIVGGGLAMVRIFPGLESLGPWITAATYIFSLCVMLVWRFKTGKWKAIKLVQREDGPKVPEGNPAMAGAATTDGMV
jgi:hypothetical protein